MHIWKPHAASLGPFVLLEKTVFCIDALDQHSSWARKWGDGWVGFFSLTAVKKLTDHIHSLCNTPQVPHAVMNTVIMHGNKDLTKQKWDLQFYFKLPKTFRIKWNKNIGNFNGMLLFQTFCNVLKHFNTSETRLLLVRNVFKFQSIKNVFILAINCERIL